MNMSTLKDLIAQAQSDMEMYKRPNVDECQKRLSEILVAAGKASITRDTMERLEQFGDWLHITTSWSSRCCDQSEVYILPMSIIEAEDPIREATIWNLNEKISNAQSALDTARNNVIHHQQSLATYKAELEKIMS
jgi:flagellar biosynthesis chaperone FliJ